MSQRVKKKRNNNNKKKTYFEQVRLLGIVSMCVFVCLSDGYVYVSRDVLSLLFGSADVALHGITALQWLPVTLAPVSHRLTDPTQLGMIRTHLLNFWTHLTCWIDLKEPKEGDLADLVVNWKNRDKRSRKRK